MKWLLILAGVVLGVLYSRFDPGQNSFFPPCPFLWLTGLPCPGCGSQRCIHQLMHGHWQEAFLLNPLLVLLLPYILTGLVLDNSSLRNTYSRFRQRWYGFAATRFFTGLIIVWWAWRIWDTLRS